VGEFVFVDEAPDCCDALPGSVAVLHRLFPFFGFTVDAASLAPWSIAVILFCGGVGVTWLLWPKVTDAWGAVNIPLTARGQAWASSSR
jgi:hypothetical protein